MIVSEAQLAGLSNDFAFIGTDMQGVSVYEFQFPKNVIITLGNEGQGMSSKIKSLIADKISIPGINKIGAESLNVAISAGIILSEMQRHQME
jgi:TrmH family RNA methyltransferase